LEEEKLDPITIALNKIDEMKYESIVKFGWDQAKDKVKIYITSGLDGVGKIPKDNITCEFEDNSIDLKVQVLNDKNYRLRIPELQ
jgi:CRISPR/Cas system CMR-associated protein Cmr5 small subunit